MGANRNFVHTKCSKMHIDRTGYFQDNRTHATCPEFRASAGFSFSF